MIRQLLALAVAIFISVPLSAQYKKMSAMETIRAGRWELPVAEKESPKKGTDAKASRLVKRAWGRYADPGFPFEDSAFYEYSPEKGLHEKLGWMFDTMTSFTRSVGSHTTQKKSSRSVHKFNSAGQIEYLDVETWNPSSNLWELAASIRFTYLNGVLSSTAQATVINGTLENTLKTEFYNNASQNYSATVRHEWDITNGMWVYKEREVTYYSAHGTDSIIYETRNGVNWERQKVTHFTYTNGNATLIERSMKNNGSWIPDYRETNTYDNNNLLKETIMETYDATTASWNDPEKEEYFYDNNKNKTEIIGYAWANGGFEKSSRQVQSYNTYDQMTVSTTSQWNTSFNLWLPVAGEDWQQRYYYEEYTTDVKKHFVEKISIKAFPIPADKVLHISIPSSASSTFNLFLTDMQGRIVENKSSIYPEHVSISTADLPPGHYLLNIQFNAGTVTKKIEIIH